MRKYAFRLQVRCLLNVEPLEDREVLSASGIFPAAALIPAEAADYSIVRYIPAVAAAPSTVAIPNQVAEFAAARMAISAIDAVPITRIVETPLPSSIDVVGDGLNGLALPGQPDRVPWVHLLEQLPKATSSVAGSPFALELPSDTNTLVTVVSQNGLGGQLEATATALPSVAATVGGAAGLSLQLGATLPSGSSVNVTVGGAAGLGVQVGADLPQGTTNVQIPVSGNFNNAPSVGAADGAPGGAIPSNTLGVAGSAFAAPNAAILVGLGQDGIQPIGAGALAGRADAIPAPENGGARGFEPSANEENVERPTFSPETSGLLVDASPFDLATMDSALQQFLDQLVELRVTLDHCLRRLGPWPWIFMGLAAAIVMQEILRRRLRQVQSHQQGPPTDREDSEPWFPGFFNSRE